MNLKENVKIEVQTCCKIVSLNLKSQIKFPSAHHIYFLYIIPQPPDSNLGSECIKYDVINRNC